jgi:hypothetical protein
MRVSITREQIPGRQHLASLREDPLPPGLPLVSNPICPQYIFVRQSENLSKIFIWERFFLRQRSPGLPTLETWTLQLLPNPQCPHEFRGENPAEAEGDKNHANRAAGDNAQPKAEWTVAALVLPKFPLSDTCLQASAHRPNQKAAEAQTKDWAKPRLPRFGGRLPGKNEQPRHESNSAQHKEKRPGRGRIG